MKRKVKLNQILKEYTERNSENKYRPVAVGRYGIRPRESIYSKELAKDYSKNKLIFKDTLTVGMGSKQIDIGILSTDEVHSVSPAYKTFQIRDINSNYLRYLLEEKNPTMFEQFVRAGARQGKTLDYSRWLNFEVEVDDDQTQLKVVSDLDKISTVINLLMNQLTLLDELVKSRFIELFEDKGYPTRKLGDVCLKITDGTHKTPNYEDSGIKFISAKNIKEGTVDLSDTKFISLREYNEIQNRTNLSQGDVLLTKSGSLGSSAVFESDEPVGLFESLAVLKPDNRLIDSKYLSESLKTDNVQRQFKTGTKGVAVKHLHLNVIKNTNLPLPPVEKQKEFSEFAEQVAKSKFFSSKNSSILG